MIDTDLRNSRRGQRPSSMYETREGLRTPNWQMLKNQVINVWEVYTFGIDLKNFKLKQNEQRNVTHSLYTPQHQSVQQCTEQVTKCIQALCKCLPTSSGRDDCVLCAENIRYSVTKLVSNLSTVKDFVSNLRLYFKRAVLKEVDSELIRSMKDTVQQLQMECCALQIANKNREESQIDYYVARIKECAYNIAKDTKEILTKYTPH